MSDEDEAVTCLGTMMIFGYKFAKNFGAPFPKSELLGDLFFYGRAINRTDQQYLESIIKGMIEHRMILSCGNRFVINHDYKPSTNDWLYDAEEFGGEGLDGDE
jgi:hypothetical protein